MRYFLPDISSNTDVTERSIFFVKYQSVQELTTEKVQRFHLFLFQVRFHNVISIQSRNYFLKELRCCALSKILSIFYSKKHSYHIFYYF
jgi:hypothetical protein